MMKFVTKISSAAFAIGLIAVVFGTYSKIQYERIERDGIETSATATHITQKIPRRKLSKIRSKNSSGEKYSSDLHLEFFDQNQVKQTAKTNIGKISNQVKNNLQNNPVVKIKYLEESPSKVVALSYSQDPQESLLEGAGVFLGGAVGIFLCRKYYQKDTNRQ